MARGQPFQGTSVQRSRSELEPRETRPQTKNDNNLVLDTVQRLKKKLFLMGIFLLQYLCVVKLGLHV